MDNFIAWCGTCGNSCHLHDLDENKDCPECARWWQESLEEYYEQARQTSE
jgi:hypothetical protein